ncbi:MAG: hypothetical protein AAFP19_15925 [Bacteroidota bacterium]
MKKERYDIPTDILEMIKTYGKVRSLKPLQVLIPVGSRCNSIFIVKKGGLLKRFYNEKRGLSRTISFHLPNHRPVVTIAESYYQDKPSLYDIKAFEYSEVYELKKEFIDQKIQDDIFLKAFYDQKVINILIYENELKSRLISYSSRELYDYLINEHPAIIKSVPSKYIAEFMCISPEWLSKLKLNK